MVEIKGEIERITYYNQENGYTIAKMRVDGSKGLVTVVGNLSNPNPGESLKLEGLWQTHPKYGEQFKITAYESVVPATVTGIERYLGSGLIKGIGPVMAKRLVGKFGVETLNVIGDEIERLHEVEGIAEKRVEMIRGAWKEQKEIREVMVFLQGHGVSPAYGVKIFKHYGKDAVAVVRDNPYRLADEVYGIGFLTADRIAEKLGIPKDSQMRAESGIQYVLQQLSDEGNVFYPLGPLVAECRKILEVEDDTLESAFRAAALSKKIVMEEREEGAEEKKAVYLTRFHVSEQGIARHLHEIAHHPKQFPFAGSDARLRAVEKEMGISLSLRQLEAVRRSLETKAMVITGGPGTGKTTIITAILRLYGQQRQKVLLAAPTGRAAKRMQEATGCEAKTIHRLLEFSPRDGKFKKDEENPLDGDLVIIDEMSMVDTVLMYYLLKAIPRKATLILVGDVDQLPSVGPGNVLKDIIDSGTIPTVYLNEIFRQAKESMIIVNAHRVNAGRMPMLPYEEEPSADFHFLQMEEPEEVLSRIVALCKDEIPQKYGYHPLDDIQVLTPMHKGVVGAINLNVELQKQLNPSQDEVTRIGRTFKTGDKVMQIRNNYDKDVYNGDIGRISVIDREEQELCVNFDGKTVTYEFQEMDELILAYATSVHKAQGSEYPVVVMPILIQHYVLLQRNLLYTGITRGKKLVVVIGTKRALSIAIRNNKPQRRYTLLCERLRMEMQSRSQA
jgi:exodeoxyribonuclease V alpha subunit